jgi:hypothetical protein
MTQEGKIIKINRPREIEKGWFRQVFLVKTEAKQENLDHPTLAKFDIVLMHAVYNDAIVNFNKAFKEGDNVFVQSEVKNINYYQDEKYDYFHEKGLIFSAYRIKYIDEEGKRKAQRKRLKELEIEGE